MSKLSENIVTVYGDNYFEINDYVNREKSKHIDSQIIDCGDIDLNQFVNYLFSYDMFSSKKYLFLKKLFNNNLLWKKLPDIFKKNDLDNVVYIVIDDKVSLKDSTFEFLLKQSKSINFKKWKDWDIQTAKKWVRDKAKENDFNLSDKDITSIIDWVGVDENLLNSCLEMLYLYKSFSIDKMHEIIRQTNVNSNVFLLIEFLVKKDRIKLSSLLKNIQSATDLYQLIGLISSQLLQLLYILSTNQAKSYDLNVNEYSFNKMVTLSKTTSLNSVKKYIEKISEVDAKTKLNAIDGWTIFEAALIELCN